MDSLTAFGVLALTAMMLFHAQEERAPAFLIAFAGACSAASACGFLKGAWPFGVVEKSGPAWRCRRRRSGSTRPADPRPD